MDELNIIMLGTGNAMVTKCYNTCFIAQSGGESLLVDAGGGNGILTQLDKAEVSLLSIHNMFITHAHTDHIVGAVWIIRKIANLINNKQFIGEFNIFCTQKIQDILVAFCNETLKPSETQLLNTKIVFNIIHDGYIAKTIGMEMTFFDIHSTKMEQHGVRIILPNKHSVVCLGDEPYNEVCKEYAYKCDWLMSEAFCLYSDRDIYKPYEKHHSTVKDSAWIAEDLKAKNLILYHTVDNDLKNRKHLYSSEAKKYFSGNIYVPDDLDVIKL